MLFNKKIVCIIPARLASTRFPEKILTMLNGKPLLQWVWEAAQRVPFFDDIRFAIDAPQTAELLKSFGAQFDMTSVLCNSGAERLVELQQSGRVKSDIWVNWQGDEPFATSTMIEQLLQSIDKDDTDMWTLKKRITNPDDITSPNIAKVVCGAHDQALYFSRSPIPFFRDEKDINLLISKNVYFKHVGLYAYTQEALEKIAQFPKDNPLENAEKLEQLRFLAHGLRIKLHETDTEVMGIDTPQDLLRAEKFAKNNIF
jgi:3-deoxy-manno-octulosonate cytidylyltransferase (CMP-KDO synthetase)